MRLINILKKVQSASKEYLQDACSPVTIYEFKIDGKLKYAISQKGGLERDIYGDPVRELIAEELHIKMEKDIKYKTIPLSEARKMDFYDFGSTFRQVVNGDMRTYSALLTNEQHNENLDYFKMYDDIRDDFI